MLRKFKRIDLTNATEDYFLKVGEEAYISFSNKSSVALHIATQNDTFYVMHLIPSNTGSASRTTYQGVWLYPNNQVYTGAFGEAAIYRSGSTFGSTYSTAENGFRVGNMYAASTSWIVNRLCYKNVCTVFGTYGSKYYYPTLIVDSSDWCDTTTPWTSLGTITFPLSDTSGEILVRRLK